MPFAMQGHGAFAQGIAMALGLKDKPVLPAPPDQLIAEKAG